MDLINYKVNERIATITLNRPEKSNAQNAELLKQLDDRFTQAVRDDEVRVIVLNANGKHFSAGHDLSQDAIDEEPWASMFDQTHETGLLRMFTWEMEHFYGYSKRWRDLPKPTIASVHGACIAAGLMLAWPCDLIIASDDAYFCDPVINMGSGGVEYHGHTWELGARKAKELLFTGNRIDAHEAKRLGMVNQVVKREELQEKTTEIASRIATMHPHALLMAKRAVNMALDAQGQSNALESAYNLHALAHANAWVIHENVSLAGLNEMRTANAKK